MKNIYAVVNWSIVAILMIMMTNVALAQNGTIKGIVFDKLTNQPLAFVNVTIQSADKGTITNENGEYEIIGLVAGHYNLLVSSVGYKTATQYEIQVTPSRSAIVDFHLEEEAQQLESVEIKSSGTFYKSDESPLSLTVVGTTEIKRTPGGNRDISKVVRSLPGVSSPPSFRNDIIIRGGAPSENAFYLDGIQIPVINHFQTQGSSGGPVGLINVDLLQEVDFYSGAFPANKGTTLSSIFDFRLKDGRQDKWTFNGIIGASDLGATIEGPVSKNSSLIFSARRSYLQFLFGIFNVPFLPVYNDFQFKYKIKVSERSKLTLLGIGAIDDFTLNLDAPEKAKTEEERDMASYVIRSMPESSQWNYTIGLKYEYFHNNGTTSFFASTNKLRNEAEKYRNNDPSGADNLIQDYQSTETEYRLRVEDYSDFNGWKLNYGFSVERGQYATDEYSKIVTQQGVFAKDYVSSLNVHRWGVFGQLSRKFADRLTSSIGLRADANDYSEDMRNMADQFSPRLSLSYAIADAVSLNFNTGIYYQLPAYTVMGYRNAVSSELVNKKNHLKYIQSNHLVGGLEFLMKRNSRITVEGFYKKYSQYPFDLENSISLANLGADFGVIGNTSVESTSEGRSYGAEFLFQQKLYKGYYGLVTYTWVRSQFENGAGNFIPSSWDNKHLIGVTGGKKFQRNWEIGLRFLFTAGAPYTPYDLDQTLRKENWDVHPFGVPDYSRLNGKRLDAFHQLDFRIDKKYYFKRWTLDLYLDVQNAYNFVIKYQDNIDVQRDASGNPVTDPGDPQRYSPKFIESYYGLALPTLGLVIEL